MLYPDSTQYNTCCTNLKIYNVILKKNIREAKRLHYEQLIDKYKFNEYAALEIVYRITTHLDNNQLPISIIYATCVANIDLHDVRCKYRFFSKGVLLVMIFQVYHPVDCCPPTPATARFVTYLHLTR